MGMVLLSESTNSSGYPFLTIVTILDSKFAIRVSCKLIRESILKGVE